MNQSRPAGARARSHWALGLASAKSGLAAIVGIKAAVSLIVLAVGFRAVSDDDYARVVIAEDWAHAPKLDPSGTSWLPAPFWLNGAAMLAFGRSLFVARAVAFVLGVASVALVYLAAHWITRSRASAFFSALVASLLPWSARLGVSTVPELPCAALTLVAVASTVESASGWRRMAGALALLAAALSRYEPWFVAGWFFAVTAFDAVRAPSRDRAGLALAGALPLVGPAAWMLWNLHAHGSPLHFVDRVAAYNLAMTHASIPRRAIGYVFAIARAEPEFLVLLGAGVAAIPREARAFAKGPLRRPLAATLLLLVALTWSSIRGGAPTHHPERAMFVLFFVLSVLAGHILATFALDPAARPDVRKVAIALAVVAAGSFPTRRWVLQSESYADRDDEEAIGIASARVVPRGQRAFVEVADYGYFAIQAATGRPEDFPANGGELPKSIGAPVAEGEPARHAVDAGFDWAILKASAPLPASARTLAHEGSWLLCELGAAP